MQMSRAMETTEVYRRASDLADLIAPGQNLGRVLSTHDWRAALSVSR